jgi:dihydrofolate reductase
MGKVIANITTSVDGYVTGPDDGPGCGLGVGGERLHYWVFGGPWTYDAVPDSEMRDEDKAYFDDINSRVGAVVAGRGTYDAAGAWGGSNPWPTPFVIVTHHPDDQPQDRGFDFATDLASALERAQAGAGGKDVLVMGGADLIRQALSAGVVEELGLSIAPVVLGSGNRLFDGFDRDVSSRT